MTTVLGNAAYAMLAAPEACTLLDLRRFLIDDQFRKGLVERIGRVAGEGSAREWPRQ